MASAITCNFPTWCASFQRSDCKQWKIVCSVPPVSVGVKCPYSSTSTEWHIWKCSLPSSRNVCRDSVSVCGQPMSQWNQKLLDTPTLNLCFLHLTHIWIRPFKPVQKRQLWSPDIWFNIAGSCPVFPSTPTELPFPFPSLFSNHVRNYRRSTWLRKCTCVWFCEWCFPFRGTEGERTARTKMLIMCSLADRDTWECMH